jgi:Transglycosylase-like domain
MQLGAAAPRPADGAIAAPGTGLAAAYHLTTAMHREAATLETRAIQRARRAARRRHLAALAAARQARQRAAAHPPSPSPSPTPAPSTGGGDAASSPLGVCIRNAEEGGSYAWGPGNGGGAYQFLLGTWEHYGGAASEFGVAGPAYQDQIFDNAIAAGGASNWTNYDGC